MQNFVHVNTNTKTENALSQTEIKIIGVINNLVELLLQILRLASYLALS